MARNERFSVLSSLKVLVLWDRNLYEYSGVQTSVCTPVILLQTCVPENSSIYASTPISRCLAAT